MMTYFNQKHIEENIMSDESKSFQSRIKKEGWIKQFTIEDNRIDEFVKLYESLGQEVQVVAVIPSENEDCQTCYMAECTKYRTIYTRPCQKEIDNQE